VALKNQHFISRLLTVPLPVNELVSHYYCMEIFIGWQVPEGSTAVFQVLQ